jgi:hypothetical protein
LNSSTTIFSRGYIAGDQVQSEPLKMHEKTQKEKKRAAIATRLLRATVSLGNTRAIDKARLTRLIQKMEKYIRRFSQPSFWISSRIEDPAGRQQVNNAREIA